MYRLPENFVLLPVTSKIIQRLNSQLTRRWNEQLSSDFSDWFKPITEGRPISQLLTYSSSTNQF